MTWYEKMTCLNNIGPSHVGYQNSLKCADTRKIAFFYDERKKKKNLNIEINYGDNNRL